MPVNGDALGLGLALDRLSSGLTDGGGGGGGGLPSESELIDDSGLDGELVDDNGTDYMLIND